MFSFLDLWKTFSGTVWRKNELIKLFLACSYFCIQERVEKSDLFLITDPMAVRVCSCLCIESMSRLIQLSNYNNDCKAPVYFGLRKVSLASPFSVLLRNPFPVVGSHGLAPKTCSWKSEGGTHVHQWGQDWLQQGLKSTWDNFLVSIYSLRRRQTNKSGNS